MWFPVTLELFTFSPHLPSSLVKKEPIISNLFCTTCPGISYPIRSSMVFSLLGLGHEALDSGKCSQGGGRASLWAVVNSRNKEAGIHGWGRKTKRYTPSPTLLPTEATSTGFFKCVILGGKERVTVLEMGKLGVTALEVAGILWPFILIPRVRVGLPPFSTQRKEVVLGQTDQVVPVEGEMDHSVTKIDLGSQVRNPQVNAVEKPAQQVGPFGFRLTAQALLWVLTSEWDAPGEGPVIGCHPVTRMLCRLGLLLLPLQKSVSSVREWVLQDREPGHRPKRSHNRGEHAALPEDGRQPLFSERTRGSAIPTALWRNYCGLFQLFIASRY